MDGGNSVRGRATFSPAAAPATTAHRDALLSLARSLATGRSAVLAEALDRVLEGLGWSRGVAYRVADRWIELSAQRGLPAALHGAFARLPLVGSSFIAQRAARLGAPVLSKALGDQKAGALDLALGDAGWGAAVAFPAVLGGEVVGVIMAALPKPPAARHGDRTDTQPSGTEAFGAGVLAFLETASHLAALAMGRQAHAWDERTEAPLAPIDRSQVVSSSRRPSPPSRDPLAAARRPLSPPGTIRHVLWIDDDDLFLITMARALAPCVVTTASSVVEADLLLKDPDFNPALIFCDIGLPDRWGTDLHRVIEARSPELARRFVFVTGGVVAPDLAHYLITSDCLTLFKPVDIDKLVELVEGRSLWLPMGLQAAPDPRQPDPGGARKDDVDSGDVPTAPRAPKAMRLAAARPTPTGGIALFERRRLP
jgi:CheY-like chemotaxis protein